MEQHTNVSRALSYYLRHKPDEIGIQLHDDGWANVHDLLSGMRLAGYDICRDILIEIVNTDSKGRYSFNKHQSMVRANQGHSAEVKMGFKEQKPPKYLYHGTSSRFIDNIMSDGLKKMKRQFVHLSDNVDTAKAVGKRHGGNLVIIQIDTAQYVGVH